MSKQTIQPKDLENFYDALAEAIDQATEPKAVLFLSKLALLLAKEVTNPAVLDAAINRALMSL